MDEKQAEQIAEWFKDKWKHGECPVCKTNKWTVMSNIGQIPNRLPFGPHGGNTVPMLLISCSNCGYTLPINAAIAGVPALPEAESSVETEQFEDQD